MWVTIEPQILSIRIRWITSRLILGYPQLTGQVAYNSFLHLLTSYQVLSPEEQAESSAMAEGSRSAPRDPAQRREAKIRQYKREKELREKVSVSGLWDTRDVLCGWARSRQSCRPASRIIISMIPANALLDCSTWCSCCFLSSRCVPPCSSPIFLPCQRINIRQPGLIRYSTYSLSSPAPPPAHSDPSCTLLKRYGTGPASFSALRPLFIHIDPARPPIPPPLRS